MAAFFTLQLAILLFSAALLAWGAKKLNQPSLVMYILGGMALGPAGASLLSWLLGGSVDPIVTSGEYVNAMSELGLAFLLFFIGLEIDVGEVKEVLGQTLIVSLSQMGLIAAAFYFISNWVGFSSLESLVIALAFMYSSTAVVVKILSEKGEVATKAGELDVSMLLFEDITVVLVMAVLASLAAASNFSLTSIGYKAATVFGFVLLIAGASIASSRYLLPRIMTYISKTGNLFLVHGLAWMFLFVFVAENYLGLSVEVGAFFAGVSIAQLPYSHELRARVKPLTDLFLAVFFLSLGLGLSTSSLVQSIPLALLFSGAVFVLKFLLYYSITYVLGFSRYDSFKSSLNMTQTSTFSIVYASVALNSGLIDETVVGLITLVALITMGISSYLITYSDLIYKYLFGKVPKNDEGIDRPLVMYPEDAEFDVVGALRNRFEGVDILTTDPESSINYSGDSTDCTYGSFRLEQTKEDLAVGSRSRIVAFVTDIEVQEELVDVSDSDAVLLVSSKEVERRLEKPRYFDGKQEFEDILEEETE